MGPLNFEIRFIHSISEMRTAKVEFFSDVCNIYQGVTLSVMQVNLPKISSSPPLIKIKNIIFDFGGVICNLDIGLTKARFKELGLKSFNSSYSVSEKEDLFRKFERGFLTPQEFRDFLKPEFSMPVTDAQIDEAWNAMLLDIPESRIRLIEKLKENYRIFILSNSNEIHYNQFLNDFRQRFSYIGFDHLFEKAWFSFQIHLQKPENEIFEFVLAEGALIPGETLFIDDSLQHVKAAQTLGIIAYHLKTDQGEDITDLFKE